MQDFEGPRYTAFAGTRRIASGELRKVALKAKAIVDADRWVQVLVFDDVTSALCELDLRGTADDVLRRLPVQPGAAQVESSPSEETRRPGRPKLGVVSREVTLLPRHWDWLAGQPGGASVALRRLVEIARKENKGKDVLRRAQDAAYRFLSALAGNLPQFEEALRAFFAGDQKRFEEITEPWPPDVREHSRKLALSAFEAIEP